MQLNHQFFQFLICDFLAKLINFSPLAMVPSSFIISQITADGFFFASLEISTEASV